MEKEKSIAEKSETPKSLSSANSSMESLSLSVENLSLNNGEVSSSVGSTNSFLFPGETSSTKIQEIVSKNQETSFDKSKRVLPQLYPQNIWAINNPELQLSVHALHNEGANQDSAPHSVFGKLKGYSFLGYARNQEGSKNLQEVLMFKNTKITSQILERVTASLEGVPIIHYLMIDQFGWHVCSKLIDSCNEKQLALIVETITMDRQLFIILSNNITASKLIKKLIKLLKKSPYIKWLVASLYLAFYQLMIDKIGSYVITYCLDTLDIKQKVLLYEAIIPNCLHLAIHEIGCISLNNFIDKIQGWHRQHLLELISNNAVFLSHDPSGNHVVQKVLGLENPFFTEIIGNLLRGHYARLSLQKWGSHVVEKCLKSPAMSYAVEDLLSSSSNQLLQVARDQFGNYVIQRALKVTKELNFPLHLELLRSLQPHLETLRYGYGRSIFNLIASGIPNEV
ncbi:hypothetical protein JCGZ_22658 [Jatropha curcas]|uniref:PUM-HD domain-containing protein n=1 Tax=Jatropha curcas TaxID=180498 RepID=A0A067JQK4_JATCU|nr:putative pumilio homolog 21 [Jatropha curcas]KDP25123.1 hypothetical protein JCGZ_22658 [Jatropha curcas]